MILCALSLTFASAGNIATAQQPQVNESENRNKAQTVPPSAQILASYEGQQVTAVDIAGRPETTSAEFAAYFVQQAGQPFSKDKVDQTVEALKKAGKSKDVRIQVDPEPDGVHVLLILEPAIYFGIFQFPGAERFPYSRLIQISNYPTETPFSASAVARDQNDLLTFFRQQGYFEAQVDSEVKVDAERGLANIVFHTSLKKRAQFGDIDIEGAPATEAESLTRSLQSIIARSRGAAIRTGRPYRYSILTRAAQYLQTTLEKEGRLGAQVKLSSTEYHADSNRADIHFAVNPGPTTRVTVRGAHLWSWTRKSLLPVYQGITVDDESVQDGRKALQSYYQAKGFFDVDIDAELKQEPRGNTVLYQISRGKKHKVTSVHVSGNSHLPTPDLSSHVTIEKSHLFSPGKFSDQLVRTSVNNLKAVYRAEGFSNVQVAPDIRRDGGNVDASFLVTEGPRDIVNSLTIEGADTFSQAQFAPQGLKLAVGQPYSQAHVHTDRAGIVANYLRAGYLNASFRETATQASKAEPHRIDVVYHIYEGPKVLTGNVITLGRQHTQQRLIDLDVAAIQPEKPLTTAQLLTAGSKLYDHTGVFDWAQVDPKRQITTQTTEDVLIKVHEAKRNEFTYGFGFELINRGGNIPSGTVAIPGLPPVGLPSSFTASQVTFYGPRGTVQYTRNNFRGKSESISFTAFAGRLDQRVAAYYIDPTLRWSRWKATTSISGERNEENPIFSSQQALGSFQMQRNLDSEGKNVLFLRYSFTQTALTRIEIPDLVPTQDRHVRLSTIAANFTRDTRDNAMDAHRGFLGSAEFDINTTKLGSSVDFSKFTGQAAYYKQAFHNIVWANSVRVGLAQPFADSRVPLSEEFFTGGGNSLRGFPLDGAGPQRQVQVCSTGTSGDCAQIQVPSGGNELLLINSEARIPLPIRKGLGLAVFYDGGNVFPSVGLNRFTSLYTNNVGLGLRYSTPVGPVRIDLGHNLNPVAGVDATQYFISIGQAF